ncbi:MAG: phosphoenolpyruvate carboxylase [Candidatus Asgardarchaeia archaeon]
MKVPRTMSTQHPDNVNMPFFAKNSVLDQEDEVKEAYFVFSYLGCEEQMWDYEGKEGDSFVVRKLLSTYEDFFRENVLGRDVFLTYRIPNPNIENVEKKVVLETLESIPRSFDAAKMFYEDDIAPIFEVILPMTTEAQSLNRIYYYYKKFIIGKKYSCFYDGDIKICDWFGDFKPEEINVIPLLEDKESMLNAHNILREYLKDKDLEYQRVFLARSDPALNYGSLSAVLINKIALMRLYNLEKELSIKIYPIIGVGSAPFRGNFKPDNIENCIMNYPSVQTFTVQSAFKYDYPQREVIKAISKVNKMRRALPIMVDEEKCLEIIDKYSREYRKWVENLAPIVNAISSYVPNRRKRKLHIGLFGYSRSVGRVKLPRAIRFCAAMYSIGLPPEIIGLNVLSDKDIDYIFDVYPTFEEDMTSALPYFNEKVYDILPEFMRGKIRKDIFPYEPNEEHLAITSKIIECFKRGEYSLLQELIVRAARIRGFLG